MGLVKNTSSLHHWTSWILAAFVSRYLPQITTFTKSISPFSEVYFILASGLWVLTPTSNQGHTHRVIVLYSLETVPSTQLVHTDRGIKLNYSNVWFVVLYDMICLDTTKPRWPMKINQDPFIPIPENLSYPCTWPNVFKCCDCTHCHYLLWQIIPHIHYPVWKNTLLRPSLNLSLLTLNLFPSLLWDHDHSFHLCPSCYKPLINLSPRQVVPAYQSLLITQAFQFLQRPWEFSHNLHKS